MTTEAKMIDAQRAYEASDRDPDRLEEMRTAQYAHDRALDKADREKDISDEIKETARIRAIIDARLARPIPDTLTDEPIGTLTKNRAEYLMMSAAVAGGAIYVGMRYQGCILARGTLPSGDTVPTTLLDRRTVIEGLRAELARPIASWPEAWDADTREILAVLDEIER